MKTIAKPRHTMSISELIADSGWFKGTEQDWRALPLAERDRLAFVATGCEVAYATWEAPTHCCHITCRIHRGELPPIALTNSALRGERSSGWLRFIEDRSKVARIFRAVRKAAMQTGIYDPWKLPGGWHTMVHAGIQG
jgi:hypothetical protein